MAIPPMDLDSVGYIYALEAVGAHFLLHQHSPCLSIPTDSNNPNLIHIKVGRTNDIHHHLHKHWQSCPSMHYKLLGSYPPIGREPNCNLIPFCDHPEHLIHTELTDLAVDLYPAGQYMPRHKCKDCKSFVKAKHRSGSPCR